MRPQDERPDLSICRLPTLPTLVSNSHARSTPSVRCRRSRLARCFFSFSTNLLPYLPQPVWLFYQLLTRPQFLSLNAPPIPATIPAWTLKRQPSPAAPLKNLDVVSREASAPRVTAGSPASLHLTLPLFTRADNLPDRGSPFSKPPNTRASFRSIPHGSSRTPHFVCQLGGLSRPELTS